MERIANAVRNVFFADEEQDAAPAIADPDVSLVAVHAIPADVPAVPLAVALTDPAPLLEALAPVVAAPAPAPAAPTFIIVAHQITESGRPAFHVSRGNGLETLYEYEMSVAEKRTLWEYRTQATGVVWARDNEDYDVLEIVDHRKVDSRTFFLIQWAGEEWQDPVWRSEQRAEFVNADGKIAEYRSHATEKSEEERQAEKPEF